MPCGDARRGDAPSPDLKPTRQRVVGAVPDDDVLVAHGVVGELRLAGLEGVVADAHVRDATRRPEQRAGRGDALAADLDVAGDGALAAAPHDEELVEPRVVGDARVGGIPGDVARRARAADPELAALRDPVRGHEAPEDLVLLVDLVVGGPDDEREAGRGIERRRRVGRAAGGVAVGARLGDLHLVADGRGRVRRAGDDAAPQRHEHGCEERSAGAEDRVNVQDDRRRQAGSNGRRARGAPGSAQPRVASSARCASATTPSPKPRSHGSSVVPASARR